MQPCMATFLSLHGIVATKKQTIQLQHNFFFVLAVPSEDSRFRSFPMITSVMFRYNTL
jgi:hypothetical protein